MAPARNVIAMTQASGMASPSTSLRRNDRLLLSDNDDDDDDDVGDDGECGDGEGDYPGLERGLIE